jgi:hypothetical protein
MPVMLATWSAWSKNSQDPHLNQQVGAVVHTYYLFYGSKCKIEGLQSSLA